MLKIIIDLEEQFVPKHHFNFHSLLHEIKTVKTCVSGQDSKSSL